MQGTKIVLRDPNLEEVTIYKDNSGLIHIEGALEEETRLVLTPEQFQWLIKSSN